MIFSSFTIGVCVVLCFRGTVVDFSAGVSNSLSLSSLRILSNVDTNSSTFSFVNTMGGFNFNTLQSGPSALSKTCSSFILNILKIFSNQNKIVILFLFYLDITYFADLGSGFLSCLSLTNSIPTNKPTPRTSPIILCFFASKWQQSVRYSPTTTAFSLRFSLSIVSNTAFAIAQDTGLPPY